MGFDLQAHQELRRLSYTVNCLVRDFCCRAKKCIGISNTGDPNLVLNQQGDWIPLRLISKYFSLISKIDVTNNGGDDWSFDFFITPISTQLPDGVEITDYDYRVIFWNTGVTTNIDNGTIDTNFTVNTNGNGAGVYDLKCLYNLPNGNHLSVRRLIKVDGSGNILADIQLNGLTVNSTNALNINVTLETILSNYSNNRLFYIFDGYVLRLVLNNGVNNTAGISTQVGDIDIYATIELDSTFSTDFTGDFLSNLSIITI